MATYNTGYVTTPVTTTYTTSAATPGTVTYSTGGYGGASQTTEVVTTAAAPGAITKTVETVRTVEPVTTTATYSNYNTYGGSDYYEPVYTEGASESQSFWSKYCTWQNLLYAALAALALLLIAGAICGIIVFIALKRRKRRKAKQGKKNKKGSKNKTVFVKEKEVKVLDKRQGGQNYVVVDKKVEVVGGGSKQYVSGGQRWSPNTYVAKKEVVSGQTQYINRPATIIKKEVIASESTAPTIYTRPANIIKKEVVLSGNDAAASGSQLYVQTNNGGDYSFTTKKIETIRPGSVGFAASSERSVV